MSSLETRSRRAFLGLFGAALGGGAAVLSGCSNFTNKASSGGSSGGGTFTFTSWGTGAEKEAVTAVVNSFCSSKSLKGVSQNIPYDSYETKLNTLLAASNAPDAGYLTEAMAMRLGEQGKVASILGEKGFENFLPQTIHHWANDKAVSQTAVEVECLWFDQDATEKAGVTPPATTDGAWNWDAMIQAADKLTVDDNGRHPSESGFDAAKTKRYGIAGLTGLPTLVALLKSKGIDMFDDAGTKTNLDDPAAIAVIQDLADLIFEHRVSPTPAQATTYGGSTALLLASQRVAMAIDGQWALLDLSQSKLKYNVGVLPRYDKPLTTLLGGANGIFISTPYKDVALELLVQLADPSQVPLYSNGLWMPMDRKYYTDETAMSKWLKEGVHPSNYKTAVVAPTLSNSVVMPAYKIKNFSIVSTTLTNGLTPVFSEKRSDVTQYVTKLADQVKQQMQGAYPDIVS